MEAVWKIEVEDFPAFIVINHEGRDFYADLDAQRPLVQVGTPGQTLETTSAARPVHEFCRSVVFPEKNVLLYFPAKMVACVSRQQRCQFINRGCNRKSDRKLT